MFGLFRKRKKKPLPTRVARDGETVRVFVDTQEIESFVWRDVASVRAWKQDCWGVDRVWLGFDILESGEPVCLHEEMEGYQEVVAEMQRRCPGYRQDWWHVAAFPAFAPNHTLVWEK